MDVSPKQLVSVAAGLDSVPRARRREPRADGLEHATPGRAAAHFRGAARRHRHGGQSRARLAGRDCPEATAKWRRVTGNHRRHQDGEMPEGAEEDQARSQKAHVYVYELRKFMRSNAGTCVNQKPIVKEGRRSKKGPRDRRRPEHRSGRTGPRPQRARRVHAVEWLQLRGRHHDLRARREGGHLYVHPHRRIRDRRPRHQARARRKSPATFRTSAKKRCATSAPTASSASARR